LFGGLLSSAADVRCFAGAHTGHRECCHY